MNLQMRWVGESDLDRVATTRALCYGPASKEIAKFTDGIRTDARGKVGDFLLAENLGKPVGTATSLSLSMWIRGGKIACQGVAWVGTIKTHRRGAASAGQGVASRIMHETLRLGREREQVVSALMPFRGSFYDHFGYGIVERRSTWTLPLAVLPAGRFDSLRFLEKDDREALAACRQRHVQGGQCDIERSAGSWAIHLQKWEDGWVAIDRDGEGPITGYLAFQNAHKDGKDIVNVIEAGYDDATALRRLLHFLASLRDQYSFATITLPTDLALNRMLRETQIPHRLVNHAHAELRPFTRMSLRVLDHQKLINAVHLRSKNAGSAVVAVKECEGHESRFKVELAGGRALTCISNAAPEFTCSDRIWAGIVTGDVSASQAVKLGLAEASRDTVTSVLDEFSEGPLPFCEEYF